MDEFRKELEKLIKKHSIDHKKEKYQSYETIFMTTVNGADSYADVEIIGYGATKDESVVNLKIAMEKVAAQIAEGSNAKVNDAPGRPLE